MPSATGGQLPGGNTTQQQSKAQHSKAHHTTPHHTTHSTLACMFRSAPASASRRSRSARSAPSAASMAAVHLWMRTKRATHTCCCRAVRQNCCAHLHVQETLWLCTPDDPVACATSHSLHSSPDPPCIHPPCIVGQVHVCPCLYQQLSCLGMLAVHSQHQGRLQVTGESERGGAVKWVRPPLLP